MPVLALLSWIAFCRAGEGRGEGTEGRGGCGGETWSRKPVLLGACDARGRESFLQTTRLAVSASVLDRAPFSVTAPPLPVVPLFMCRWCGCKAGTVTAPRTFGSVTFQWGGAWSGSSVDVEGSCPLSGSGRDVGVPAVTVGCWLCPQQG